MRAHEPWQVPGIVCARRGAAVTVTDRDPREALIWRGAEANLDAICKNMAGLQVLSLARVPQLVEAHLHGAPLGGVAR